MTRGLLDRPPTPGKAPAAGRAATRARCLRWASLVLAASLLALAGRAVAAGRPGELPEGNIAEIKFQGNQSIPEDQIRGKIKSRAGRPLDRVTVEQDMKALLATKWFSDVRPVYEPGPDGQGFVLTFQVDEMPVLRDVQFVGRDKIRLKDIEETTGLKKGARADSVRARLAVQQIQTLYEEKGYEKAEVRLLEGGKVGDTRVIIEIFEGPKFKVDTIDFVGNTFVEDGVLRTKIESRRGFFGLLGAKRYKDGLENDKRALIKYYQDNGFFEVRVSATTKPGAGLGQEQITFTISEGVQFKVRKVLFEGNRKIPEAKLAEGLLLKPGSTYNEALRDIDFKAINTRYWGIGCIDTRIEKDQPITDQPGLVDVVYKIEEGEPFILGRIIVKGNARTKDKVVRREALMSGLVPGEKLDLNRIETFKKRLGSTGFFQTANSPMGKAMDIQIINKRPGDQPFGDDVRVDPAGVIPARMQGPDPSAPTPDDLPPLPPLPSAGLGRLDAPGRRRGLSGYFADSPAPARLASIAPAVAAVAAARPEPAELARLQSPEPESPPPPDEPPAMPAIGDVPPPVGLPGPAAAAPGPGPGQVPPAANAGPSVGLPFGASGDLFAPQVNTVPAIPVVPPPPDAPPAAATPRPGSSRACPTTT